MPNPTLRISLDPLVVADLAEAVLALRTATLSVPADSVAGRFIDITYRSASHALHIATATPAPEPREPHQGGTRA